MSIAHSSGGISPIFFAAYQRNAMSNPGFCPKRIIPFANLKNSGMTTSAGGASNSLLPFRPCIFLLSLLINEYGCNGEKKYGSSILLPKRGTAAISIIESLYGLSPVISRSKHRNLVLYISKFVDIFRVAFQDTTIASILNKF